MPPHPWTMSSIWIRARGTCCRVICSSIVMPSWPSESWSTILRRRRATMLWRSTFAIRTTSSCNTAWTLRSGSSMNARRPSPGRSPTNWRVWRAFSSHSNRMRQFRANPISMLEYKRGFFPDFILTYRTVAEVLIWSWLFQDVIGILLVLFLRNTFLLDLL